MTRDEYYGKLHEAFAFEEPQNQGGQVIWSQTSDIATVNGLLTADYPTVYITRLHLRAAGRRQPDRRPDRPGAG